MKKIYLILLALWVALSTYAQHKVHGQVVDAETGEPLVGASVLLKTDKKVGAATDLDGNFEISVPEIGDELLVSYIGYVSTTIKAAPQMTVNLQADQSELEEVVVVGYYPNYLT